MFGNPHIADATTNSDHHRAAIFCNVPIREWQETAPSANFDARMTSKNHPDDACFDRAGLQRLGIRRVGFRRYSGGSFVPRHSAEFSPVSSRWLAVSAAMPPGGGRHRFSIHCHVCAANGLPET
jgi:hypothetical protein